MRPAGVLLCLALAPCRAASPAGRQYQGLPFPPYEIFDALTAFADGGDLPSLEAAAGRMGALFEALDPGGRKGLRRSLSDALASRDKDAARRAVLALILEDLRFNLDRAREAGPALRGELLQMAFTSYHYLSPAVRRGSARRDQTVRERFKAAYRAGELSPLGEALRGIEETWKR